MKEYFKFSASDFAQDDEFLCWVKFPGRSPEIDKFWETWVSQHPEKVEEVDEARRMILAIVQEGQFSNIKKQREVWEKLQDSIGDLPKAKHTEFWNKSYSIAAAILLLIIAGSILWLSRTFTSQEKVMAFKNPSVTKEINEGNTPKTVLLKDGTSILLQPQSTVEYSSVFNFELREVKLTGEAFFDVARDPNKPFLVYTDKLVTKVLGTSFTIRAYQNEGNIQVQVKTGKVSVFTESDVIANQSKGNAHLEGVLLTPNQQVIFSRQEVSMIKSLVENPSLLSSSSTQSFEFKDTPLHDVFDALEKGYGIEIIYDEETMKDCALNASLNDMSLYDKLRLICKGVNAQYEILDSHIVITGQGCK